MILLALAALTALNDYPTTARAEFVFACMAANGQTQKALSECACAIDHIATVLSYDDYVAAETVLRMRQTTGERANLFRDMAMTNDMAKRLQAAEAESEVLCFTPGS